jgi:hypothetical protein
MLIKGKFSGSLECPSVVIGTDCKCSYKSNYHIDGEEVSGNIKELMLGTCKHFLCGHFIITSIRNPTEINESCNSSDANCIWARPPSSMTNSAM